MLKNSQARIMCVIKRSLTLLLACGLSAGAFAEKANDHKLKQERDREMAELNGFEGINIEGNWNVQVAEGPDWQVTLNYPDEIGEFIGTDVKNGRLWLRNSKSGLGEQESITPHANIVMPALNYLAYSGGGSLSFSGFHGPHLALKAAGEIDMQGTESRFDEMELGIAGTSNVDVQGVLVTDAEVKMAGSSTALLSMAGGALSGSIAGSGTIKYHGEVASQDVKIAGSGRVDPVE